MINHLGINPVRGGRPPRDNKIIKDDIAIMGDLFQVRDKDSVEVVEEKIRSKNIEEVMII